MPSSGDYIREYAGDLLPQKNQISSLEAVNFVTTLLSSECNNTWTVYAETVDQALLELLVGYTEFDEGDVLRFIFRPKGLKRGGHLKADRLRRAAGKIPGLRELQGRRYTSGVRNLWVFDTSLQRIFFWWMIIGLSTDFLYRWTTLATGKASCIPGSASKKAVTGVLLTVGAWAGGRFSDILYDSDTVRAFGASFACLTKNNSCFAGINVTNPNEIFSTKVSMRAISNTAEGVQTSEDSVTIPPKSSGSLVVNHTFNLPGSVGIQLKTEGFGVNVDSGDVFCNGT